MNLVNEQIIKELSLIPINYQIDELLNFVPICEYSKILPLIGESEYGKLLEMVYDKDSNDWLVLVQRYECLCLVEMCLPYISYHLTQVGITKGKSNNSESVGIDELNYLKNHLTSQIEVLRELILKQIGKCDSVAYNCYSFKKINADFDGFTDVAGYLKGATF